MAVEGIFRRIFNNSVALFSFFFFFFAVASSDELRLLLTVKESFRNSKTNVFDNWNSNTLLCNFTGITCNSNGSVTEIDLARQGLSGSVPFDSICSLRFLEKLDLGNNSLSGEISGELKKCVGLKYLDIGNNFFSGEIPDISSLSELTHLYVDRGGFRGKFPWNSLENMTNLELLSIGDNPFDITLFPEVITNLTRLNWLYLSNCSLEGKIPEGIGNLTELINLELSMNRLSGEIPAGISNLRKLWQLELYSNELTGKFPVGFGNLSKLEFLDASTNYLYGDLSEIRHLNQLVSLQLLENQFSGEVPAELGEFKKLVNVSLYTNKLSGQLPAKLGSWSEFDFIDISENFFTGPIPPEMCKQGKMRELLILQNNFSGAIPENYKNCSTLRRFRVNKNSLSGTVPAGFWGLPNVDIIDISSNRFEGPIASDIRNAKSLRQLFLADNKLSGNLPPEISGASALVSIDLSNNQFSGEIPAKIGELKQVDTLYLQNNNFVGSIPEELSSCEALSDINIAHNSVSGQIPSSLGSLQTLTSLNLSDNQLSGQIPSSLSSLKLNVLDLSNNQLSGPIPESLSIEAYNGSFAGNQNLCSNKNINSFRRCSNKFDKSNNLHIILLCLISTCIAILVFSGCLMYIKKKKNNVNENDCERSLKEDFWHLKSFHLLTFSEDEILDAIKQDNLIGKGGSGNVYRVVASNGAQFAVKHIWNFDSDGRRRMSLSSMPILRKRATKSKEFEAEVQTLSSIRHVNVVKLYCSITSEDSSLLVYEYLPNGSLWDRLHSCDKMTLDWETRYEIALGAAKGLEYLHHCCDRPVIHRDIKSSNILLDEFLKPRIADFGLAKLVHPDNNESSTHVIAGTHGYIAPEYGYTHKVDVKSDVYSFGVVLMELVLGKRPIEAEYGENNNIVSWVSSKLYSKESVLNLVDSEIPESCREDAIKVLRIAIMCTARLPSLRPSMRTVVKMLEDAQPCNLSGIIVCK